jgi:hypothetical protein
VALLLQNNLMFAFTTWRRVLQLEFPPAVKDEFLPLLTVLLQLIDRSDMFCIDPAATSPESVLPASQLAQAERAVTPPPHHAVEAHITASQVPQSPPEPAVDADAAAPAVDSAVLLAGVDTNEQPQPPPQASEAAAAHPE